MGPIKKSLISNTVAFLSEIGSPVGTACDSTAPLQDVANMVARSHLVRVACKMFGATLAETREH